MNSKGNKKRKRKKNNIKKFRAESTDRLIWVAIGACTIIGCLLLKLLYLTTIKSSELSEKANEQWKSEVNLTAKRGDILDRNGSVLVTSANVYRIDVDIETLRNTIEEDDLTMEKVCADLAEILSLSYDEVYGKLGDEESTFATLARGVEKSVKDAVENLDLYGIITSDEITRYYPNGNFLSQVLGIVNSDGEGLTGLELQYDKYLSGLSGLKISEIDGYANTLPFISEKLTPSIDGKDVVTTIDENIQYYAELVANEGLETYKAKRVSILVMNPNTGEVLGMAMSPGFDPNNPYEGYEIFEGDTENDQIQNMWRDSIVSDTYEPGSTFKIITMIAAMEEGLVHDDDVFECNGYKEFDGVKVRCWNLAGHGKQTTAEILKNSCNVGFMELGARLGAEKLNEYIEKLGFGNLTGIDLPGEAEGIVKSSNSISEIDLGTIAFGQTNTVTPIQLMAAFNTVANGGTWIQPHIVKEISHVDESGNTIVDKTIEPRKEENLLSAENTLTLRKYLERTATQDEGAGTFVQGYDIGGKTGTAQKVDPETGSYSADKYIASMVALSPIDNPQITAYIAVDEPSTGVYYGGQVAAPLMKKLFSYIFGYTESPVAKGTYSIVKDVVIPEIRGKSIEEAKKILEDNGLKCEVEGMGDTITSVNPYPGTKVKVGSKINLTASIKGGVDNKIVMPDLTGNTVDFATTILDNLGLNYEYEGSGKVVKQSIPSGELITTGTKIKLVFKEESEY